MSDLCDDNRFELIEKYKKELIEATNIETAPDEMAVLGDILFRFWQMGWLESIDRMPLVKESAITLIRSVGNSVSAKAFRNAGRFIQNAIDGEPPEFEFVQASSEIPNNSDTISRQAAIEIAMQYCPDDDGVCSKADRDPREMLDELEALPSAERQRRWTSCDQQLPENEDPVLCCTQTKRGFKNIVIGYYSPQLERWCCGMNSNVMAWMQLPEPYQEGETRMKGEEK